MRLAVDVADLQVGQFCAARAGGIEGHQQGAMEGCVRGVDQTRNFFLAENCGKVQHLLRIRGLRDAPARFSTWM